MRNLRMRSRQHFLWDFFGTQAGPGIAIQAEGPELQLVEVAMSQAPLKGLRDEKKSSQKAIEYAPSISTVTRIHSESEWPHTDQGSRP